MASLGNQKGRLTSGRSREETLEGHGHAIGQEANRMEACQYTMKMRRQVVMQGKTIWSQSILT